MEQINPDTGVVTTFSSRGEDRSRNKKARDAEGEMRVTSTRFASLTRDDLTLLQLVMGFGSWFDTRDPASNPVKTVINATPAEPGDVTYTLDLDFLPRFADLTVQDREDWVWDTFRRTITHYRPSTVHPPAWLATLYEQMPPAERQHPIMLFWMLFDQPKPLDSPGSFEVTYGLSIEGAPTNKTAYECFSPLVQTIRPGYYQYMMPKLRIEGRMSKNADGYQQ